MHLFCRPTKPVRVPTHSKLLLREAPGGERKHSND